MSLVLSSPRPHSLSLSLTYFFILSVLQILPLTSTFSLANIVFFSITALFIHLSPSLSLYPVCCITSLNSYGPLNYLHKLLLYRDLLNILARTRGVQNLQCHRLPPLLFHRIHISFFTLHHQPLRELVFIINISCDVQEKKQFNLLAEVLFNGCQCEPKQVIFIGTG